MSERAFAEEIDEQYRNALEDYLSAPDEGALLIGYDLGRRWLGEGRGLLEMVSIHSRAVATIMDAPLTEDQRRRLVRAQSEFFVEALSPFEMANRAFRDANATLRRLNDVLEGQAKRIAYALHDEAGQLLASVQFALADAEQGLPAENAARFVRVRTLLGETEQRLRNLSHELRPPVLDDLGLKAALELLAVGVIQRWALSVKVLVSLKGDLPASIENTLYRICSEALTNVAKHAEASRAEIDLRQVDRMIVCSVRDDGIGIDDTMGFRKLRPGLGLNEIRERVAALGGTVHLGLNKERGTDLTVEIPFG